MTYPHITRYECPIGACPWTHDDPGPDSSAAVSAPTIEEAVFAVMSQHMAGLESVVRAHLETHPLEEWVREVMLLRDAAATEADLLRHSIRQSQRELADTAIVAAVLVRKLGGSVTVDDADLAAEQGTLIRIPEMYGFTLEARG